MKGDITKYQDLSINGADLNGELERQASSFVYVGEFFADAEAEYENYKLRVKQLVAALDEQIRIRALKERKKITEASISKEIERHPDYIKAMEHQINLYKRKEKLRTLRDGWRDRLQLLIQRCINERAEMENLNKNTVKSLSVVG